MTGGEQEMEPQQQQQQQRPQHPVDSGAAYTFSSASFRKKKKKSRKLRNKKIITQEEAAVSKRGRAGTELARSQSTSALLSSRKTTAEIPTANHQWGSSAAPKASPVVVTPTSAAVVPTESSAVSPSSGSPIGRDLDVSDRNGTGQQDHELDLTSSSARLRTTRKPWETDIEKKQKTEYGDKLLRDGPSSAGRIATSRAASHHENFRRSRSLSTSRHRSLSTTSRHQRLTGNRLFSDNYRSSAASSSGSEDEFSCDNDETDPRDVPDGQSSFDDEDKTYEKYRQFLASTKSKENDEAMSRQSVLSLKQKVGAAPALSFSYRYSAAADELLGLGNADDYDGDTAADHEESEPNKEQKTDVSELEDLATLINDAEAAATDRVLDDVVQDPDATDDSDSVVQGPSPVVEQEANSPPSSPVSVSSPHPPSLAGSLSPITYFTTSTAATSDTIPPEQIQQPQQQEEEQEQDIIPVAPLLSGESEQHNKQETSHSMEGESGKVDKNEVCSTDAYYGSGDDFGGDLSLGPEESEGCSNDNESRTRDETQHRNQEHDSFGQEDNHQQFADPSDNSSEEPNLEPEPPVRSRTPSLDSEESEPIQDLSGAADADNDSFDESSMGGSTTSCNDDDLKNDVNDDTDNGIIDDVNDDVNDDVDDEDGQDSKEEPEYPEEDRELLSLLYHIHTA